jgi:predicted Ser/Thr protein kinase
MAVATSKSASSVRLSPSWAQALRWLWIAFTTMSLILLVISLPQNYQGSRVICDGEDCAFININSENAARYEEGGVSLEFRSLIITIAGAISAIIFVVIASIIFFSRPNDLIAIMTAFAFVGAGITGPIDFLQPDNIFWEIGLRILQGVGSVSLAGFFFIFPNGRFVPRWTQWVFIIFIPIVTLMLIAVVFDFLLPDAATQSLTPLLFLGLFAQIYRYFRISKPEERQQTKWVLAALLGLIVFVSILPFFLGFLEFTFLGVILNFVFGFTMITLIPLSVLVSILRFGLWDIDFYINRGIVYLSLTALLVAVFAGIFFALQTGFNAIIGSGQLGIELIVPTAVVVGLFNPARKRLRHFVDRRFYGIKMDYTRIIESRQRLLADVDTSTTIGQYRTTNLIGSGGMGEVYAGEDTQRQRVAIKVLHHQFEQHDEMEKRFLREAQATAQLEHPNIVKILNVGEDKGRLFIAMEYVQGDDWGNILKTQGALHIEQVMPRLSEMASALDYVHQNGIIHRDIKPSNVMIEAESNRAVLMDFGIAKIATEMTALTGTSQIVGSLDYISPEQIQGQENIDYRTDIYSFGVMAYQLLSGELPFKKGNAGALVMAHLVQPPPDICDLKSDIPDSISDAIIRAMAKQPTERFDSLSDFVAAMQD